jgi:hypothetical protein
LGQCFIATIFWRQDLQAIVLDIFDERHGTSMSPATHYYLHTTQGAQFVSGFALRNFTIGNGSSSSHCQFSVDSGKYVDEDIEHTLDAIIAAGTTIPVLYITGSSTLNAGTLAGFPLLVGPNSRPYYNQQVAGVWQLTQMGSNDFVLYHIFAINGYQTRIVSVMGQNSYGSIATARAGASVEVSALKLGLPLAEIVPIGTIIFEVKDSFTNSVNARIVATAEGGNYVDWRSTELATGYSPTSHSNLTDVFNAGPGVAQGHISDQEQTIAGNKTFSGDVTVLGTFTAGALPTWDIGTDLPALPPDTRQVQARTPEGDGNSFFFFDLKKIFAAQGENHDVAEQMTLASYANLYVLEGTGDVLLIDSALLAPGSELKFSVMSAGVRFRHMFDKNTIPVLSRPANFATLVPLHLATKSDYTTINEKEPFTFALVQFSTGLEFHDWTRSTKAGSVEQTTFVATRAEGAGLQVELGFSVWGFTNGETDTVQRIYGSASFQPNAAKNGLVCTGAGVLTGIKTTFDNISVLSIVAADLADGRAFCIGTSKRVYPVSGTATVGAVSDDSGWFEHSFGYTFVAGGALVINDASKGAQISL